MPEEREKHTPLFSIHFDRTAAAMLRQKKHDNLSTLAGAGAEIKRTHTHTLNNFEYAGKNSTRRRGWGVTVEWSQ